MAIWQAQDAKAKFSQLMDTCIATGPQTITRHGVPEVVMVPVQQWESAVHQPTLQELLLGDGPRFDLELPQRGKGWGREIEAF